MELHWKGDETITVTTQGNEVLISANKQGLRLLGTLCHTLAEEAPGCHIHLDAYNGLEEGSSELIIEHAEPKAEAAQ